MSKSVALPAKPAPVSPEIREELSVLSALLARAPVSAKTGSAKQ
jgi:hypothetical protein